MQGPFQQMSHSVTKNGFWISDTLVSKKSAEVLLFHAQEKFSEDQFRQAHVGKGIRRSRAENIRKDQIHWIENWKAPALISYTAVLEELLSVCRREFFLPLKRFEGHFSHYEKGAFYVRHIDRHSVQPHRLLSTVLYLNDVNEGGELVLFKEKEILETLHPKQGRFIIFDSQIPHEVRKTTSPRWTLTSWLRDDVL